MKKKFIIVIAILGVVVLGVLGLVIAFTMPKDLGVRYTQADVDSVNNKLGITYGKLATSTDPRASLKLSGSKKIDQEITQSEMTALLNQPSSQWKNYPVSKVQMRINTDGSVEMTGKILAKRFNEYSEATNMPEKFTSLIKDKASLVPINPSFYYKGDFSVKNNKLEGEMTELKIGTLDVPKDWVDNNKGLINEFVEDRLNSAGMKIETATFSEGKLDIKSNIPETIDFEK